MAAAPHTFSATIPSAAMSTGVTPAPSSSSSAASSGVLPDPKTVPFPKESVQPLLQNVLSKDYGKLPLQTVPADVDLDPEEGLEALASQWKDMTLAQDVESMVVPVFLGNPNQNLTNEGEDFFLMGTIKALRNYSFKAVEKAMLSSWNPIYTIEIREIEPNLYLIRFTNRLDLNKVLRCGPWRFNDYVMSLKETKPGVMIPKENLHWVEFWIQIYGIPPLLQTEEQVRAIGSSLGTVWDAEPHVFRQEERGLTFMRVRVEMDVGNKLPRGTILEMGLNEQNPPLFFKYERLFAFCFWCGMVDHIVEECVGSLKPEFDIAKCGYGEWLKGIPPRPQHRLHSASGWSRAAPAQPMNPFARGPTPPLLLPPAAARGLLASGSSPSYSQPPPGFPARPQIIANFQPGLTIATRTPITPVPIKAPSRKRGPKPKVKLGQEQQNEAMGSESLRVTSNKKKRGADKELQEEDQEVQFFEPLEQA